MKSKFKGAIVSPAFSMFTISPYAIKALLNDDNFSDRVKVQFD